MTASKTESFVRGKRQLENLIRGDALIGLIKDVPATIDAMMDDLWSAACSGDGEKDAYRALGECYFASFAPIGAFDGVPRHTAEGRPWSGDASVIIEESNPLLEAAMRSLREAVRLGDRVALMDLARVSRRASAAAQRSVLALFVSLDDAQPHELYQRGLIEHWLGDLEASAESHHRAAERGNADALFELHLYYAQGIGVVADAEAARTWLERAAQSDHPRALYNLGAAYASPATGAPDTEKAAEYYERAANQGHGRAAATLAAMVLAGEIEGTEEDATMWLDQADESGFPSAELLAAAGLSDPRSE